MQCQPWAIIWIFFPEFEGKSEWTFIQNFCGGQVGLILYCEVHKLSSITNVGRARFSEGMRFQVIGLFPAGIFPAGLFHGGVFP